MKPVHFSASLRFAFAFASLCAAGCTAQVEAPPPAGPPPPELQIGADDEAQGEADPPPPPSTPEPAQAPAPPTAPPPPPAEASQTAAPPPLAAPPPGAAPNTPPAGPAPVAAEPATSSGQWIYTSQYGWIWTPYGREYTQVSADGGSAYEYAYYPNGGWRWVYSPWVLGWGPSPYWGRLGPRHYVWYSRPWFRVGVVHRGPVYHRRWHRR